MFLPKNCPLCDARLRDKSGREIYCIWCPQKFKNTKHSHYNIELSINFVSESFIIENFFIENYIYNGYDDYISSISMIKSDFDYHDRVDTGEICRFSDYISPRISLEKIKTILTFS